MEQLFDNLSRTLATASSRRDALRGMFAVLFGGAAVSGCATSPSAPSCDNGCVGTDNKCYTCSSGAVCTTAIFNSTCSSPSAGGIYCCSPSTSSGSVSTGGSCPCASGTAYNPGFAKCCPRTAPWYDPGGHGYSAGCYPSCPYVGDCGNTYTLCN